GTLPFTAQISPSNATSTTVSWSVFPSSIATINGISGVLTALNDGIVTVTGTVGTVVGISIVTISGQNIIPTPTITFTGIPVLTFGGANISLKAVSSNGQAVSFLTSNASVLGINNSTGIIVGAGIATVSAFVGNPGSLGYAIVSQIVEVRKATQSIIFTQVPIQYVGNPNFPISVSASSGLIPSLTLSDSSSIRLRGNWGQVLGLGVTSITAQQAGNANYLPAMDVKITVYVADNGSNDLAIFGKDVVPRLNRSNYYISQPDSSKTYEWFYSGSGVTFDTSGVNTSLAGIYFQSNATSGNVLVVIYDKDKHVVGVETRAVTVFDQTQEDPVGNNLSDPQCLQVVNECLGNFIETFEISQLGVINTSRCSSDGFADYTRINTKTKLFMGYTYSIWMKVGPSSFKSGIKYGGIWIDYNNNGSFSDPEDFVMSSLSEDSVLRFKNILIRNTPDFAGSRRLRIRMRASGNFNYDESCPIPNESGETEDYTVFLTPVTKVETPDIITPNGDNLNEYFIVKGLMTDKSSKLTVFDQFGNLKYTNDNYQNDWNGIDQKGNPLKESTYYYVYVNGDITLKGFVEVKY
ncbi:MAG: gliding motility-associated C-terminal domain-containing protein, partial [Cytophagales bacterium]|nr:gliding motility-associated C-terminal domain-containing protein [Cytophagales bacterium]